MNRPLIMSVRNAAMGAAMAACLAFTAAAHAQPTEDIIVMGRYGNVPSSVQTLSQSVSYADLDLSLPSHRTELKRRVTLTARYLCQKLGETSSGDPVAPSCQTAARNDALKRIGTIEEGFAPRGTAWVAPPAWHAPYPSDWVATYRE